MSLYTDRERANTRALVSARAGYRRALVYRVRIRRVLHSLERIPNGFFLRVFSNCSSVTTAKTKNANKRLQ